MFSQWSLTVVVYLFRRARTGSVHLDIRQPNEVCPILRCHGSTSSIRSGKACRLHSMQLHPMFSMRERIGFDANAAKFFVMVDENTAKFFMKVDQFLVAFYVFVFGFLILFVSSTRSQFPFNFLQIQALLFLDVAGNQDLQAIAAGSEMMRILPLLFAPSMCSTARISSCTFGVPAIPIMLLLMKYVYFFELRIRASRKKGSSFHDSYV